MPVHILSLCLTFFLWYEKNIYSKLRKQTLDCPPSLHWVSWISSLERRGYVCFIFFKILLARIVCISMLYEGEYFYLTARIQVFWDCHKVWKKFPRNRFFLFIYMCLVRHVPIFFMYILCTYVMCVQSQLFMYVMCVQSQFFMYVMGLFEGHEKELKVGLFEGHEKFYVYMYVMCVQPQFFSI